ncbi:MAG: isochorismate synthase, partial [Acidimicrobiales bacterium]
GLAGTHGLAGAGLDRAGPAGAGGLDRTGLDGVIAALAGIETLDDVGRPASGPIALGALPFDPAAPAVLVVPAMIVAVAVDGTAWKTTVSPRSSLDDGPVRASFASVPSADHWPPDHFELRSPRAHQDWCAAVVRAVDLVRSGSLDKVVLAREVVVQANRPFLTADVLGRLRALYPSCTTFSMDGVLGASPELLVSRRGPVVVSHPLAGTVARSGDPATDEALAAGLLASAKERREHQVVVDAIAASLGPLCDGLELPPSPSIVSLRNVSHLGTRVEGRLAGHDRGWPSVLDLVGRLHPTPAVAGTPTAGALAAIAAVEGLDRGRYAGPVGWVDSRGDGDWVIGIRSATVEGATARLVAGVGIVADSDPRAELTETQLKLQALLAALVRP